MMAREEPWHIHETTPPMEMLIGDEGLDHRAKGHAFDTCESGWLGLA